jgi:hypothetical protein
VKRLIAIVLFVLGGLTASAEAQEVPNKPQVKLDPAKAYVLYQGNKLGQTLTLISIPTSQAREEYQRKWRAALAEAKIKYQADLSAWNHRAAGEMQGGAKPGPKPVAPTETNFNLPLPINVIKIGVFNRFFAKSGNSTVYLAEIPAGDYYVADAPYGMFYNVPATCLCLGTVRFHVSAGQITDMGRIVSNYYEGIVQARAKGTPKPRNYLDLPEGVTSMAIVPAHAGDKVDPRIGNFPVNPAAYRPFGKFPNIANYLVDRLTAMPGVFRYDRDTMVDLTSGAE